MLAKREDLIIKHKIYKYLSENNVCINVRGENAIISKYNNDGTYLKQTVYGLEGIYSWIKVHEKELPKWKESIQAHLNKQYKLYFNPHTPCEV